MTIKRVTSRILLLLLVGCICSASSVLAEDTAEVIGLITELSDSKEYIQVNDYSITSIAAIAVKTSSNGELAGGSVDDLVAGALVKAEVEPQSDGSWSASLVTVYTGDAKTALLAQVEGAEAASIESTESNLAATSQSDESKTDDNVTEQVNNSNSSTLHFENGVWKN